LELSTALELDQMLAQVAQLARPVPSLAHENAAHERARLVRCLQRGEAPVPAPEAGRGRIDPAAYRLIDEARARGANCVLGQLYLDRIAELELDLAILDAWGDARRVRPISARRYGRGDELVELDSGPAPLGEVARGLLARLPVGAPEERALPAMGRGAEPSVAKLISAAALGIGLDVDVRIEPRLSSLAAAGERTVFLAPRNFTLLEARRLVAHEVFGHLVAAANARAQPLRLLSVGVAGAFADQEGVALLLEEQLGVLCNERLRTLAARVVATRLLFAGASFVDTARTLFGEHGFDAHAAIAITERTYRGGGVARDAGYLAGYLRVRAAVRSGSATLDELRMGRVSLASLSALRELVSAGVLREPCYRPSLSVSRRLTLSGTSPVTSPPNAAASFTMFELT
jgi:uncharacterized protein (TIGR02421 family)